MLKLNSINIASEEPKKLSEFYENVLDMKPSMVDGDWYGFQVGGTFLGIGPHDKVKGKAAQPERMMFNLETPEVKAEFDRIKEAGADVIAEPYEMQGMEGFWIATLADPDGNYFQLMSPWKE